MPPARRPVIWIPDFDRCGIGARTCPRANRASTHVCAEMHISIAWLGRHGRPNRIKRNFSSKNCGCNWREGCSVLCTQDAYAGGRGRFERLHAERFLIGGRSEGRRRPASERRSLRSRFRPILATRSRPICSTGLITDAARVSAARLTTLHAHFLRGVPCRFYLLPVSQTVRYRGRSPSR